MPGASPADQGDTSNASKAVLKGVQRNQQNPTLTSHSGRPDPNTEDSNSSLQRQDTLLMKQQQIKQPSFLGFLLI